MAEFWNLGDNSGSIMLTEQAQSFDILLIIRDH